MYIWEKLRGGEKKKTYIYIYIHVLYNLYTYIYIILQTSQLHHWSYRAVGPTTAVPPVPWVPPATSGAASPSPTPTVPPMRRRRVFFGDGDREQKHQQMGGFSWDFHGNFHDFMEFSCDFHGNFHDFMEFLWDFHGNLFDFMDFSRDLKGIWWKFIGFHGISRAILGISADEWDIHGSFMRFHQQWRISPTKMMSKLAKLTDVLDLWWICLQLGKTIWVCLKIGYIPNYSHLIGIMIISPWV